MNAPLHSAVPHEVLVDEQLGLEAILAIPADAKGLVIFAHGSGSGRLSPRNNYVAAHLREAGLATLLPDLLTLKEEQVRSNAFDIRLLATRLRLAADWAALRHETRRLRMAYFGASTGGGAALRAAADDLRIAAVVSRGGRPDLAGVVALGRARAPTLLVVGGNDMVDLKLNITAYNAMHCKRRLAVMPRAGHLFEEPGALDSVIALASAWFIRYLDDSTR